MAIVDISTIVKPLISAPISALMSAIVATKNVDSGRKPNIIAKLGKPYCVGAEIRRRNDDEHYQQHQGFFFASP
jgi:hypothetical protein